MNRGIARAVAAAVLIASMRLPAYAGAQESLNGQALLDALRQGGYVIVMRHATTEPKPDASPVDLANCATQRNLASEGQDMARAIGSAVSSLRIPVGRVISSPFCRAKDTAMLAFGHDDETVPGLGERAVKNDAAATDAASSLRATMATAAGQGGSDTVVVTHGFNIKSIVGADFAEGEAAVFKPDGKGGFSLVARVLPQDWTKLGH
jgi:phosphohistidine phosphatase SixA